MITVWITERIERTSEITLLPDNEQDQEFMTAHEDLLVLACAGDKEASTKLYDLLIDAGYDADNYDTTGADVTDVEVVEK